MRVRLGTRGSALAIAQSGRIADELRGLGARVDLVRIETPGDGTSTPLPGRALEGIFTSSLQQALEDGVIDLAVHSCKDLPTQESNGTMIAALPPRADPRDALIGAADLSELRAGAIVGTCSVRRAAWVQRHRPDLQVRGIRGNIDDRITRQRSGEFDAIILAVAGLQRLGRTADIGAVIDARDLVPAPAQGALALEIRRGDTHMATLAGCLDDPRTRQAVAFERALLAVIDPADATAFGALAEIVDGTWRLLADRANPDGTGRQVVERRLDAARSPADDRLVAEVRQSLQVPMPVGA